MNRSTFVLAAMASAGAEARFDPVRLQKYFFLLDRELDGDCGCPRFSFRPHHYGPFDEDVQRQVEQLAQDGLATVDESRGYGLFGLTEEGLIRGTEALASLPQRVRRYMVAASEWLFALDLPALLLSIYEYAPDMAARSIQPQVVRAVRRDRSKSPFLRGMARSVDWAGALSRSRDVRPAGSAALARHWSVVGGYLRTAMKHADSQRPHAGSALSRPTA